MVMSTESSPVDNTVDIIIENDTHNKRQRPAVCDVEVLLPFEFSLITGNDF